MADRKTRRTNAEMRELVQRSAGRIPTSMPNLSDAQQREAHAGLLAALQADGLTRGQAKQMAERLVSDARKNSVKT